MLAAISVFSIVAPLVSHYVRKKQKTEHLKEAI